MSSPTIDFAELIEKDRTERAKDRWKGTFLDYLELVKEDPGLADLAHKRLYDMLTEPGELVLDSEADGRIKRVFGDRPVKVYNFFKDEFFGMEKTLDKIVRYFHAAAMGGEEARQVLYLMGPVGSGKSSLVERLKRGLEQLPPIHVIDGCPIFEQPLHLIPRHLRQAFEEMLDVKIDGDLCPICRHRLMNEYDGKYETMPVRTVTLSKRARRGVGVVPPVDPNNQDTSVLIGSEDISKLDRYSEGDPRVLELNGAFNVGNRGMVEFIEVFKNETEYLHTMITATQERFVPAPGRHGTIHVDTCIIAHSNEAEWQKFKADHTNEAILDRIVVVKVPYNLRLSEESKIYRKFLDRSKFKVRMAPHTLEIAAMFAILSRLEPNAKCDLVTKLKIYNGEEVLEKGRPKKLTAHELREDTKREGLFGISTRFIMKALDTALAQNDGIIHPINVRESLISMVKEVDMADDTKKLYLEFLQDTLHKAYLDYLEKDITKAFVYSFKDQADTLFQNYLDHAEAHVTRSKVKDPVTRDEIQPDEAFLKSIEEQIAIIGPAADGFRQEVIAYLWSASRRGEKIDYSAYEPLKEAIEKKLMSSVRDISRIITKARTRDSEQREKYDSMVENLISQGYDESSIDTILKYAANHLWKD
ncbi:MAG: serine protein kinase [Geminicoccaceae bacterium]|nr:serine protein kinase [Geminicoccaceae bacterium]